MKRLLLSLCLVGAAIYLLIPPRAVPVEEAERISDAQTRANHPVVRSWGPTLRSLRRKPQALLAASQEPAAPRQNAAYGPSEEAQDSEQTPGAYNPSTSVIKASALALDNSEQEPVEWARVIFAARVHSEASVSSPTIRFYRPGTELQVVRRENSWLELADPVTQERGWVFQKYLVSIDSPSPVQAAKEATTEPPPVKVASPKSQKPSGSIKLTARVSDDVEVAKSDRRGDRLARRVERRRGLGLFRFGGRKARAAWSIGPAR
jgi:hypothetical protein